MLCGNSSMRYFLPCNIFGSVSKEERNYDKMVWNCLVVRRMLVDILDDNGI